MIDETQIREWWSLFVQRCDGLVEVRGMGRQSYSGYFKNFDNMLQSVKWLDEQRDEPIIYFTLNQVNSDCYSRNQRERLDVKPKFTTSDKDIVFRKYILVDLDPQRSVGINSSNEELGKAKIKAREIYEYLKKQGFNDMILAMSGNGYHLLVPCNIEVSDETTLTIKRFLGTLAIFYGGDGIDVDTSVFNPSRICKLYGTVAKKGSDSPERPRRLSHFVYVPHEIQETPLSCFERIAALYPEEQPRPSQENRWGREKFNLENFMQEHSINYRPVSFAEGTKYLLDHCPFDPSHKGKDAVIFQRSNGAIGFHCFHNSCQGKTWKDVRLLFEPNAYSSYNNSSDPYRPILRVSSYDQSPAPSERTDEKGDVWLKLGSVPTVVYNEQDYIKSGLDQIDHVMMGFKRGHVSVWTGKRGCGKSSLLNELTLNAANYGAKTALWSGELDAGEMKKWILLQAASHHTRQSSYNENFYYCPREVEVKIVPWLDKYIRLYNNRYSEDAGNMYTKIEQDLKLAYEQEPFDVAVFDNLMILGIEDLQAANFNEQQKELMKRLHYIAMQLKIHVHLVAHPNKQQGFLRMDNISGTGHISDLAQNVFLVHRTGEDFEKSAKEFLAPQVLGEIKASGCTNIVEIGKCRDKGTAVGKRVRLYFDIRNNQLQEDVNLLLHYGWEEQVEQTSFIQPQTVIQQPAVPPVNNEDPFDGKPPYDPYLDNNSNTPF